MIWPFGCLMNPLFSKKRYKKEKKRTPNNVCNLVAYNPSVSEQQFPIRLNFEFMAYSDYFDEHFCPIGENGVITRSSTKYIKLPFRKIKLGTQSLSYVGPNTWNSLPDNLKSATSVNSFKHYIKEYFLKTLGNV